MKTLLLASSLAALALAGAAPPALAQTGPSMTGVWNPDSAGPVLKTIEGQTPPLTAAGKAAMAKTLADRKAGKAEDPVATCLPPGTPRVMWQPQPMLLLDTPRKLTMIFQYQHYQRHVYLDDKAPATAADLDPTWGGSTFGQRDGDGFTLVTEGFNGETFLDGQGLPTSPDLKLTEHIKRLPNGKLEDRITIEDPVNYSQPFTVRMTYTRAPAGTVLQEDICNERVLKSPVRNYWAEHQAELKAGH